MQSSWFMQMIRLLIVYVASKHSIPTQVCLNTNSQNQSKCHNNHFNIRTNRNIEEKSCKNWKILGKRSAILTGLFSANIQPKLKYFWTQPFNLNTRLPTSGQNRLNLQLLVNRPDVQSQNRKKQRMQLLFAFAKKFCSYKAYVN